MITTIRRLVLGLALAGLAACGGGDAARLGKVKDAMCACKDRACTKRVEDDSADLVRALREKYKEAKDIPHALIELDDAIKQCKKDARRAEDAAAAGDDVARLGAMKDAMCACHDPACVERVSRDQHDFMQALAARYAGKEPNPAIVMISHDLAQCMVAAGPPAAPAPAPAPAPTIDAGVPDAAVSETGLAQCDLYVQQSNALLACDKVPADIKREVKQAVDQMKKAAALLAGEKVTAAARRKADDACKQAQGALAQVATATGCPL